MKRHRRHLLTLLLAFVLAAVAASCGGGGEEEQAGGGETATEEAGGGASGKIAIMGIWTGEEQKSFQAVIDGFNEQNPDVTVRYTSAGDQLPTQLATAVEGGNPPDLAAIAQPGLMEGFAERKVLKPLDFARQAITDNFGEAGVQSGSVDGKLYGLLFKANNKSTVWYNVQAFEDAGVEPPESWDEFLEAAKTINASGLPAFSIAGADGWTLTDLFENIYIRTAGVEKYDQLSKHEIPWTDPSVKEALGEMAKIVGDPDNIAGGTQGALQTDFPTSVSNVFSREPKAAMVIEADFVPGVVEHPLKPQEGFDVFGFPALGDSPESLVVAGNLFIAFNDTPAVRAFVEYLTTPEAAEIWAKRGGFSSPNRNLDENVYPDPTLQETATAISEAESTRFDLSDLQPIAFGGTVGQGLFKLFQDFLKNPDNVDAITRQMEQAAAKAYK